MSTPPVTVPINAKIWQAAADMEEYGCGFLPVVEKGIAVGILTARDIAVRLTAHRVDGNDVPVFAIMSSPPETLNEDVETEDALILMRQKGIHRVAVTDRDGRVTGVISLADLAGNVPDESILKTLQRHAEQSILHLGRQFAPGIPGLFLG